MTFIQKLVTFLLPKQWSAAIQAESDSWLLTCSVCGSVRSVWEVGGIRFKAASVGKRTMIWCAQCGQLRPMSMHRKPAS
jgi:translation initiation factor 2 beta subunit (eIF-2beta)/eIF-5